MQVIAQEAQDSYRCRLTTHPVLQGPHRAYFGDLLQVVPNRMCCCCACLPTVPHALQGRDSPGVAQQHCGGAGDECGEDGAVVPNDHLPGPVAGAQVAQAVLHPSDDDAVRRSRNVVSAHETSPVQCICILAREDQGLMIIL